MSRRRRGAMIVMCVAVAGAVVWLVNDPTATAIADAIFRMTTATIEGAGGGVPDDRTLYGVVAALMHLHQRDASNITLYQSDDSTVLVTIPISTDPDLDPISQINPP